MSWNLSVFDWTLGTLQSVYLPDGGDQSFLTGHKVTLRTQNKMEGKTTSSFYIEDPQQSLSKEIPAWWELLTHQYVRPDQTAGL